MEYRRFDNTVAVRLDPDEEILEQLEKVVRAEKITLGHVSAIGAIKEFTIGVYSVPEQKYYSTDYTGAWEVVSLIGNITTKEGEPYLHLHMSAADDNGKTAGGHLNRAIISATSEIFITVCNGSIERIKDPRTGLNVLKF